MGLISPISYKYLEKWFATKWLHGHPYVWNNEQNAPELTNSTISLALWHFNVFIFLVNFTFVQFRTIQVYFDTSAAAVQKMYMTLISALWLYEALFRIVGLWKRREIVEFLQQFFIFVEKYSDEASNRIYGSLNGRSCELFLMFVFYGLWINASLFVGISILMPWSPEFFSSLLPNARLLNRTTLFGFTLYHALVVAATVQNNGMIIAYLAMSIFPAAHLARMPAYAIKVDTSHRQLTKRFRLYGQLLLQVQKFSEVFQLANGGSYVLELTMCILYIYGAIRLEGLLSALCSGIALNCMVFAVGLVNTLAGVNQGSKGTLRCLKEHVASSIAANGKNKSSRWLEKYLRGLPELRIHFGFICHYDKQLVLTTMQLILLNSATLLLTM